MGCTEKGPVIDTENTRDTQKDSPVTGVPIAKRVQKIYSNGESLKVVESTVYASFVDGEIGFLLQTGDAAAGYMQKMLWTTSNGGVNWEEDIFTLAGIQ